MTNRFHLGLDSWGTKIVAIGMFLFLATNTWHFIQQFIPADTFYHRPVMFLFFEGGLLYWFNRLEHASENVAKTIIAAFMTLVQLAAVGFATVYELTLSLQRMMGYNMDQGIVDALPFVITGLVLLWIIMWALGRLANQHFVARISHIAKTGVSPHVANDANSAYVITTVSPATKQLAPAKLTRNIKALPAEKEPTTDKLPAVQNVDTLQRIGAFIGERLGMRKIVANATEYESSAAAPVAVAEGIRESEEEGPEIQYNVAPKSKPARAHTRSSSNSKRARRSSAQIDKILTALDKADPGQSDASLARAAGCSTSTVSRWRKGGN